MHLALATTTQRIVLAERMPREVLPHQDATQIVTVTEGEKMNTKRDNKVGAGVNLFPGSNALPSKVGEATAGRLPGLNMESNKAFTGEGKVAGVRAFKQTIAMFHFNNHPTQNSQNTFDVGFNFSI